MYTRDELLEELYAREALLDEDYLYARSDLYQDLDLYTREEALFLAREANLAAIENKVKTSMHNTKESVKGATKNTHAAAKIRELEANSCNFRKCALAMAPTIGGCAAAAAAMGANPVADVSCTGALVTAGMKLVSQYQIPFSVPTALFCPIYPTSQSLRCLRANIMNCSPRTATAARATRRLLRALRRGVSFSKRSWMRGCGRVLLR